MLSGFVDIHHHLLYETDDGPANFEQSVQMLHRAVEQGISCIAATPHILPGHIEFDAEKNLQKLEALREYIVRQSLPLEVIPGAEVLYTAATASFVETGRITMLGNSWHMLMEFHPYVHYDEMRRAILSIGNMGYSVVLAHAERYRCLRIKGRAARLQTNFNVQIQFNSDTVIASHKRFGDRWIRRMLREGMVDIIASDAHNTSSRPCTLGDCAKLIAEEYGEDEARRMCINTPRLLLNEKNSYQRTNSSEE